MSVYDFDRFSKHDQIGQVVIPLSSLDLCQTLEETRDISSPDEEKVTDKTPYLNGDDRIQVSFLNCEYIGVS